VLLALCKAAPLVEDYRSAEKLAMQLAPYTREAHTQIFLYSPFFREVTPSPIESLSYNLTSALLSLGINHDGLQDNAAIYLISYLDRCAYTSKLIISSQEVANENETDMEDATNVARLAISLLGFLDAAATYANFWSPAERLSLIVRIKEMLSENFLISVETAFSKIRNSHSSDSLMKEWKRYVRHYAAIGRPLGAMLLQRSFMSLLVASTSLLVTDITVLRGRDILDLMISGELIPKPIQPSGGEDAVASVETIAAIAAKEMEQLEDGADYLRLGSAWQQRLAFSVKAGALISYLNCVILNDEAEGADADTLVGWLEEALDDPIQMADESLASVVLRCMALAARLSPEFAPNMSKRLPRFIVQRAPRGETVIMASNCLAFVIRLLSLDAVISTLYTLGNVLTPGTNAERVLASAANGELLNNSNLGAGFYGGKQNGSAISLTLTGEEETTAAHGNVVQAIRIIASSCKDENITALAQSMLLQKINKVSKSVDANIIYEAAVLAVTGGPMEFRSLLKFYGKLTQEGVADHDDGLLFALRKTRNYLSSTLRKGTAMYDIYLENLLEAIISRGDVRETQHTRESDVELAAQEIAELLQPLAILMATNNLAKDKALDEEIVSLFRDAWFNMLVHGFSTSTERGKKYINELRVLAIHSRPLVTEQRSEQLESDIEVNPVLRRGINSEHEATQKKRLTTLIPSKASEIRSLSYRKIIFLHTAYVIETLRAESGDCTKALKYFLEPGMRTGDMSSVMEAITVSVIDTYLRKTLTGTNPTFSAPCVAKQLVSIFCDCCHRIERVQQAAILCADRILHAVTSALCQKTSLFALLELLSLMWISCLEAETDEYEWKSSFTSVRGKVTIQLSDNFELRRRTLNTMYRNAKQWVMQVIDIAPLDVKGLLQTYLSEYDDDGAYGHISLGRSFAVEMGSVVPRTDQKLGAIDHHGDTNINAASDFIAQYTTRQEYRYAEALPDHDAEWLNFIRIDRRGSFSDNHGEEFANTLTALERLEIRMLAGTFIPLGELRDVLRRAAALLCRSKKDECAIIKYLVGIPFAHLTKQSIKLGISLWLGVINENPRMQPRIMIELAYQWENTIHRKQGIFNDHFL
jgi:phosphatidylinositol 4-kinase